VFCRLVAFEEDGEAQVPEKMNSRTQYFYATTVDGNT
jgi:hypothetical protein